MKNQRELIQLFYSRQDCAVALGCGLSKVDKEISSGELKSFMWHGSRMIHIDDLNDFAWKLRNDGTKQTDFGV